eukprot:7391223-Prymnesium_polylepis.1
MVRAQIEQDELSQLITQSTQDVIDVLLEKKNEQVPSKSDLTSNVEIAKKRIAAMWVASGRAHVQPIVALIDL